MVELQVNIEKKFPNFISSIRFSLTSSRCGVFGPSGSGKSTLMKMVAGLLAPDAGSIQLNGRPLFDSEKKINLPPEKRRVGVVFQHGHLFPHLNVRRNLYYGLQRRNPDKQKIHPELLISILKLEHLLERKVTRLSGGEKQRVALGRTILSCPDLILLDEPLTGLDCRLKYQIIPQLRQVFSAFSIPLLFISHSLQEMRMMTEEVLVMHQGMIDQHLSTEELARTSLGSGGRGYENLLRLEQPEDRGDLVCCQWGSLELMLVKGNEARGGQFSLNSRDILLFKKHPEATSARNILSCTVQEIYRTDDWLVGVLLDCRGNKLIAEVVPQSVHELAIKPGTELVAVIKASAFQRLY